jgi:hypothetical protein
MTKLKKHDVVAVYQDPYTCKQFEGNATLLHNRDYRMDPGFEIWSVCFEGDNGMVVDRAINLNNCKSSCIKV